MPIYPFRHRPFWPAAPDGSLPVAVVGADPEPAPTPALAGSSPEATRAAVLEIVLAAVTAHRGEGSGADAPDPAATFRELGVDSVGMVELRGEIGRTAGVRLTSVVLFDHPPGITIGREGSAQHVRTNPDELAARGWPVNWVARGGGAMLHATGQVACYPVFPLDALNLSAGRYVSELTGVACDLCLGRAGQPQMVDDGARAEQILDRRPQAPVRPSLPGRDHAHRAPAGYGACRPCHGGGVAQAASQDQLAAAGQREPRTVGRGEQQLGPGGDGQQADRR